MAASTSRSAPSSAGDQGTRWAVGLASGAAVAVAVAVAVYGIAYAAGGTDAPEDNAVGLLTVALTVVGLVASMTAFALGVMLSVRSYPRSRLWLPLTVFPVLVAMLVLGELFWWE